MSEVKLEGKTCDRSVKKGSFLSYAPCGKPAKVEVDGKYFCGIHDPIKRKAREQERNASWDAQREVYRKDRALRDAAPALYAALYAIVQDEGDGINLFTNGRAALAIARGDAQ